MQSYIRTYYRLRKREPLIALGSHQGEGGSISACAVPHRGGVAYRFEHPRLAEVVRLIAYYDTRSESSGIFYYPSVIKELLLLSSLLWGFLLCFYFVFCFIVIITRPMPQLGQGRHRGRQAE